MPYVASNGAVLVNSSVVPATGVVFQAGIAVNSASGAMYIQESLGLSTTNDSATATANTAAIQAALDEGGLVQITTPGTYYINATLTAYDNTRIVLGEGVELIPYANTSKSLITNSCYLNTLAAVTSATSSGRVATVNTTAAHGLTAADVGTYIALLGSTTDFWTGIFPLASVVDSDTFTLTLDDAPITTTAAGTLKWVKANYNIEIVGGKWNYDTANNPTPNNYNVHALRFNFIRRGRVVDTSIFNATKYAIHFVNSHDCAAEDVFLNTASDGVHFDGMAKNPTVRTIKGRTGDDFVAFTILQNGAAGSFAYTLPPSYLAGDQTGGNAYDLTPSGCLAAVKFAGSTGNKFRGMTVSGVKGTGQATCVSIVDDGADLTGTNGDITIRDVSYVSANTAAAILNMTNTGVVNVTLDGWRHDAAASKAILISGPFGTINLRNGTVGATMTTAVVRINAPGTGGNQINFSDIDGIAGAAGMLWTTEGNSYTVAAINHVNVRWNATTSTSYIGFLNSGAASEVTEVNATNLKLLGTGVSTGQGFTVNTGTLRRVNVSNGTAKDSGVLFNCTTGAEATAPFVKVSNFTFDTVNRYMDLRQGGTVELSNVVSSGLTSQPIFLGGTSKVYVIRSAAWQHGLTEVFGYGTTPVFTTYGWDITTDPLGNGQATTAGQYLYSTRATAINQGPMVRTAAGWIALGTGAAGVNTVAS